MALTQIWIYNEQLVTMFWDASNKDTLAIKIFHKNKAVNMGSIIGLQLPRVQNNFFYMAFSS